MSSSLQQLVRHGVEVNAVLDIGVLNGTAPLQQVFPDRKHYLFEPVEFHFDTIRRNYANFDHELFHVALSDGDGESYLVGLSVDGGDEITHSQVCAEPMSSEDNPRVLSCQKIRRAKLDTLLADRAIEQPHLFKIDVDGHELPILRGAVDTLRGASIVVIEATIEKQPIPKLFERFQFLVQQGFVLIDLVDMAWYDGILWQVDMIFVRQEIAESINALRPFEAPEFQFDRSLWQPVADVIRNQPCGADNDQQS